MIIRRPHPSDALHLQSFWLAVATVPGGVARNPDEISDAYIADILEKSRAHGLMLLGFEDGAGAEDHLPKAGPKGAAQEVRREETRIMAVVHAFPPAPAALASTLSELTIGVRPAALGKRYGQELLEAFLKTVEAEMPHIARVELQARASNERGLRLYEALGFVLEGRLERRIRSASGELEADVIMAWFNPGFDP